ncbi:hypothetical protein F01_460144 [Burkholderia cenocepacia]|nr:hypothetical protein F01_460144 [Burkholderia cenocepacia]
MRDCAATRRNAVSRRDAAQLFATVSGGNGDCPFGRRIRSRAFECVSVRARIRTRFADRETVCGYSITAAGDIDSCLLQHGRGARRIEVAVRPHEGEPARDLADFLVVGRACVGRHRRRVAGQVGRCAARGAGEYGKRHRVNRAHTAMGFDNEKEVKHAGQASLSGGSGKYGTDVDGLWWRR